MNNSSVPELIVPEPCITLPEAAVIISPPVPMVRSPSTVNVDGALLSIFNDRLQHKDRFVGVRIDDKEDVYPALKQFFGRRGVETPA